MTFFFYGSNSYALKAQVDGMVAAYLKKTGSDIGLERLDAANATPERLRAALTTAPFLSNSRLVIVAGLSGTKTVFEKLGDPLKLVPSTTVAVFADPGADKRTSAFKHLLGADKTVSYEPLTEAQLTLWAGREIKRLGGEAERGVAGELVRRAGADQGRISNEVAKLVAYAPQVTRQAVMALVPPSPEQTVFELVEAATSGRVAQAFAAYRDVLHHKDDHYFVLTMLQWQLRGLLLAASAPPGLGSAELAKRAGLSPYVAGKMMTAARRHAIDALTKSYRLAVDAEYSVKRGRQPVEAAVETLLYRLSAPAKDAAA